MKVNTKRIHRKKIVLAVITILVALIGFIIYRIISYPNNIVIGNYMVLKKHPIKNPHMDQENKIDKSNHKTSGKFSESEYVPVCWEIAPHDPNQDAQTALFGIAMKKIENSDGSYDVALRPNSGEYPWKKFHVLQKYTLYFCDYTDDDEEIGMTDLDITSNKDDFPILVDPKGIIVPGQNLPDMSNVDGDGSYD